MGERVIAFELRTLSTLVDANGPAPQSVVGVSCFVIAPPFRRHGVAAALLDRVIADAPAGRGASCVEGYPHNEAQTEPRRRIFAARVRCTTRADSEPIEVREHYTVMRLSAVSAADKP